MAHSKNDPDFPDAYATGKGAAVTLTLGQLRLLERVVAHGAQDYPTRDAREDAELEAIAHAINNSRRHAESVAPSSKTPASKVKRLPRAKVA